MLWGCMSYGGLGQVVEVVGNINSETFCDIISDNLRLSAHLMSLGDSFIFQLDNAPVHTSRYTRLFFETQGIQLLDWPAQSPDLNPIENLWSWLKKRIAILQQRRGMRLRAAIDEAKKQVPLSLIQTLINSMPRRLQSVIDAKGFPTKY